MVFVRKIIENTLVIHHKMTNFAILQGNIGGMQISTFTLMLERTREITSAIFRIWTWSIIKSAKTDSIML